MAALVERLARRLRGQEGFTLVEVLMASLVGLIVVGASVMVFSAAQNSQPRLQTRDNAIQQARFTMERLTRELRQGSTVSTASPSQLTFETMVHSASCGGAPSNTAITCQVTYTCTAGSCIRVEAKPDGTSPGSPTTVVTGLSSSNVFNYSPNTTSPTYIGATLIFPGQNGGDAITLSDGAALQNITSTS